MEVSPSHSSGECSNRYVSISASISRINLNTPALSLMCSRMALNKLLCRINSYLLSQKLLRKSDKFPEPILETSSSHLSSNSRISSCESELNSFFSSLSTIENK